MAKTHIITVYATFADIDEAERIIEILLANKLIACANVLPQMVSYYEWNGDNHKEEEVAVLFKTQNLSYKALESCIVEHHSYDVPCVTSWSVEQGYVPYLEWVKAQTG